MALQKSELENEISELNKIIIQKQTQLAHSYEISNNDNHLRADDLIPSAIKLLEDTIGLLCYLKPKEEKLIEASGILKTVRLLIDSMIVDVEGKLDAMIDKDSSLAS